MRVIASAVDEQSSTAQATHNTTCCQIASFYCRNIQIVVDKSDFSEELKKFPDDGRMTETCRSVFKEF